jgi:hypothetical protein
VVPISISILEGCGGEWGSEGMGVCGNSVGAETVFLGVSLGMIWKRYW